MAWTTGNRTVQSSVPPGDYTTIKAGVDDLTTLTGDCQLSVEITDHDEDDTLVCNHTSATYDFTLTVPDAYYHGGVPGSGVRNVITASSTAWPWNCSAGNCFAEKMEFSSGINNRYVVGQTNDNWVLIRCLVHAKNAPSGTLTALMYPNGIDGCEIHECMQWSDDGNNNHGVFLRSNGAIITHTECCNNATTGIREDTLNGGSDKALLVSCACLDNGTDYILDAGAHASCDNNVASDTSAPGSNPHNSQASATIFDDNTYATPGSGFLELAAAQAGNFDDASSAPGTYAPGVDVAGTTLVNFDAGCFEIAAAPSGQTMPIISSAGIHNAVFHGLVCQGGQQ